MYLNIQHFIDSEYEQEKLLETINMLKYCENALDRKIRLAREDEAERVTKEVTKEVTEEVSEKIACNLLRDNHDIDYVHEMTQLPIPQIKKLKEKI
jgi:hypothetical protein